MVTYVHPRNYLILTRGQQHSHDLVKTPQINNHIFLSHQTIASMKSPNFRVSKPEMVTEEHYFNKEYKFPSTDGTIYACFPLNELTKQFQNLTSVEHGGTYVSSASSSSYSLGLNDENQENTELNSELAEINSVYRHWFEELAKMREHAMEAGEKSSLMKKKMVAVLVRERTRAKGESFDEEDHVFMLILHFDCFFFFYGLDVGVLRCPCLIKVPFTEPNFFHVVLFCDL